MAAELIAPCYRGKSLQVPADIRRRVFAAMVLQLHTSQGEIIAALQSPGIPAEAVDELRALLLPYCRTLSRVIAETLIEIPLPMECPPRFVPGATFSPDPDP